MYGLRKQLLRQDFRTESLVAQLAMRTPSLHQWQVELRQILVWDAVSLVTIFPSVVSGWKEMHS